ncbi:MAG TPA: hypothetical protein VJ208_00815 [Candidatus Nanoarchaeia archaeon]|nr:hypothetical protein [Candidatus Nanoarchaeia archaeon]
MPPIINVSDEVFEGLKKMGVSYEIVAAAPSSIPKNFIYVPSTKLHVAKEKSLQGRNWFDSHKNGMQTLPKFVEFLKYARKHNQDIYNEITQIRNPFRGEWIDAYFEKRKDGMYVLTENKTRIEKLDEGTLMEDKKISLDSWLDNPTKQGLPKKEVEKGNLDFWYPRNNSVATFFANGVGSDLDCNRYPPNSYSYLGVRAVGRWGVSDVLLVLKEL